eukprot:9658628-Alexandrium_andersonii.AAC.1
MWLRTCCILDAPALIPQSRAKSVRASVRPCVHAVRCGGVGYGAVHAVRCGAVQCGAVQCVAWGGVAWRG